MPPKSHEPIASPPEGGLPEGRPREASPLSLSRLRDAFAAMLNPQAVNPQSAGGTESSAAGASPSPPAAAISPRSVVEALLFVGRPDNRPFSARELAAAMRGVSPAEIESVVAELNAIYETDAAAYQIVGNQSGYRLVLRDEFARMRDKLNGRVREAKLSPAAVEVLAVVAYKQPVTLEEISQLRQAPSSAALSTLVRRRLVRLERPPEKAAAPQYWTTERFLRLFGLENLSALPRSEELGKS